MFFSINDIIEELVPAEADARLDACLTSLAKNDLIVIDEMGYLPLNAKAANLFFRMVNHLYEFKSIIITSNRLGSYLQRQCLATAILDRLLHHSQLVTMMGDSFRLKDIIQ